MISPRIVAIIGLAVGVSTAGVVGCMSSAEDATAYGGYGTGGMSSSGGRGGADGGIDANVGQGGSPGPAFSYADLCGGGCMPATGQASDCGEPLQGGGGAGAAGPGGGGAGPAGGGPPGAGDCRLAVDSNDSVNGDCGPANDAAGEGDPCFTASDCGPGLGCVAELGCRPYCCGDPEACPPSSYCAPVPIAKGELTNNSSEPPLIPVCVPATSCTLLAPTSCPQGLSCTVVRSDGTTSCVEPGTGTTGLPCPCAPGYMCATGKNECMQLCTTNPDSCPEGGICQGDPASFPPGFGVCAQI